MLPYAIRQIVWMLTSALQLIYALSTGVVWVMQMLRFFVYGACVGVCFIPHWWWYLTSPNIIRRVSYRSSEKTKRRNILRVLEAEGVDLREVLCKDSIAQATQPSQQMQLPPSPATAAAAARRRRRLATVAGAGQQDGAARDCSDSLPHTVDGEVDDRSLSQLHNPSPFSTLRCWEASGSGYDQRTPLGLSSEPLGRDSDSYDEASFVSSSSQRRRRRPTPSRSVLTRPCHGGTEASTSGPPGATALERLMGAVTCNLNPADGSAMRSLPLRRRQQSQPQRPIIEDAAAHRSREPEEGIERRQDAHNGPSVTATARAKAHSSSSSGGTETQPRKPRRDATGDEAAVCRAAPEDSTEEQMNGCRLRGSPQRVHGYEGRPVHYKTLPKVNPSSDPMLRDVLAAFHEAEASDVTVGLSQAGHPSGPHSRRQPGGAAARRPRRRSGAPPPQRRGKAAHEPRAQPQHKPRARTFSKENLFAELDEEDEEDRMNLHNRATVDIVLPAPLDAIMKTLEYTQQSKRLRRKRFPIVIDVSGVAWIIGSHLWSTMIARVLAQRGYVVFCPDYRNFPQTTMEGMTLDVSDAIAWVLNNAERYNGDLNNVTLIGQSAGAHLTMMSLLSQAQLSAYRHNAEKGIHEGVPPPSDVAYNVPRYNPRESIHRYVGLSGMYNIEGLVDHFQAAGLTTPVLYQIAGGRDQLARYTLNAYFDDRRGGDTGEVLPDNIFDFFPQRMFFVHGDADKSAPVTESASLVGMMRAAQERYTLRRSARNEEARRHAQRSRRLLPGALAAAAGEVKSSSAAAAAGVFPSPLTGLPSRRATVVDFDTVDSAAVATAAEQAVGAAVRLADNQEIIFVHSKDLVDTGAAPNAAQQQQYSYGTGAPRASILSPTKISPIIPPSREDRPQPPVELGFLVIPGGRHSDAFVDECIAAGRSCCVDFLCDYESTIDFQGNALEPGSHGPNAEGASGNSLGDSVWTSSLPEADKAPLSWAHAPEMSVMPDAVLPLAVPYEDRSLPLRLCTMICPF
ncbi:alpha/beta hydrolase fold/Alpha/beta hydrolase family/Carboxylesterase family, putative [Leishmania donovani]|uniref:Alpha/beta hydrolase fold/Alpha/beta hydrolase family/Carboxylesterase family, putative n=1 Tax=Leishmania donovani TaxID=5661 RepID=A0A3S5H6U1_LEIDO|nr:alpha/beta hydrolase fold/Alpha/beta hydrolase family/Carboxylesterase family, putative [Leishmania donovani]